MQNEALVWVAACLPPPMRRVTGARRSAWANGRVAMRVVEARPKENSCQLLFFTYSQATSLPYKKKEEDRFVAVSERACPKERVQSGLL